MDLTNEEIVTRLLVSREILQVRRDFDGFSLHDKNYNLGDFLENSKSEPKNNLRNDKYIFIGA